MMKQYAVVGSKRLDIHTATQVVLDKVQMKKGRKEDETYTRHHFGQMKVPARDVGSHVFHCWKKKLQVNKKEGTNKPCGPGTTLRVEG